MSQYSIYPGGIDSSDQLPISIDLITPVKSEIVNRLRDSTISIESELGIEPSGTYSTVRARLDAISLEIQAIIIANGGLRTVLKDGVTILTHVTSMNFTGTGVEVTTDPITGRINVNINSNSEKQETRPVTFLGQTSFTLTQTPDDSTTVEMFVNGNKQQYGVGKEYSVTGTAVTYTGALVLQTTDVVEFWYITSSGTSGGGGGGGGFTPGGDLAGTSTNQSVISIHGANVPIAGSLTTGNVLQISGSSALSYGPINLAGGSNYVTGVLPEANQADQTMLGDVTGTTAANTVTKLQNRSVANIAPTDTYVLTWVASNNDWEPQPSAGGTSFTAGGDLSGTNTNQTVIAIHGASVPVAGSLVTGNGLYVTAASTLSYGPLNLAGGANFVTGVLPIANQSSQTMAGDVTGTTAASVVVQAHGATIPIAGSLISGNVLQVIGSSVLAYGPINLAGGANFVTGVLPIANQAVQTMTGDVTGTTAVSVVAKAHGATVPVAGALTTGNVLQVSGASALSYGPLNLAGGVNFVTGSLPSTNQIAQTMAGDVTGTTAASVVAKVHSATVPIAGALTTGNVLQVSGVSALSYAALNLAGGANFVTGVLPVGNHPSLAGDVTGTITTNTVVKLQGRSVANIAPPDGYVLTWVSSNNDWEPQPQTGGGGGGPPSGSAGGDLGNTYPNPSVLKIHSATVPIAGSLVTGNVLQVTGSSALSYAALNLAGGADYVAGLLPEGNQEDQTMIGDVTGTTSTAAVIALQGRSVANIAPIDGYVLTWVSSNSDWEPQPQTGGGGGGPPSGSAGGDLGNTYPNPSVLKIHSATVPAAGALTTGNGLYVTGVSALSYSALNLAGGANFVTGVLPAANQAVQTMAGDVTGTTAASVVAKVNAATVPAAGALTTGNVLQVTGASTLSYAALNLAGGANFVTGLLPAANQSAQTMAGDVTGTTAASVVAKVHGATVPVAGALTTGNGLYVTGISTLSYSALNLAGGVNFVTGVLPVGNQASQTMAGDVTGTTAASVVAKVNAATVPAAGALTTGNILQVSGASALSYGPLNLAGGANFVTGLLPAANQVAQTIAGDVTGTTAASVVAKAHGATVPIAGALVTGNVLQVSGISALSYAALNLAGGANFVTGLLPEANQVDQTMIGDVTGTTSTSTVIKLQGRSVANIAPVDGYVLTWVSSNNDWEPQPQTGGGGGGPPSGSAGGDLGNTYPNPSVLKIHSATVPIAGSLVTGNVLQVSGTSALSYAALNLAGGANFVTGLLPAANQSAQTMAGDVTGTTAVSVVAKVHGATVPVAGALTTGNGLYVTGVSALSYSALNLAGGANFVTGLLPAANQSAQTMAGDVTGTTAASVVAKVNAATVPAAGALTTGNILQVSGASALSYGPLNLSGGANFVTGVLPIANQAAQAMAGDVSGTTTASVVAKAHGATVPVAGALVPGNVLQVSGASALSYGPLNLAGGANFVTGLLPTANQTVQTMAGDVTGTTAASVVAKAHGATVPVAGALTTGNILQVTGVSALSYAALNLAGGANFVTGVLPVGNLPSLAGDVTGTITANTVTKLQGRNVSSTAPVDAYVLTWVSSNNDWEPQPQTGGGGGGPPTGSAGGDLGDTYPNPSVLKIHSATVPIAGSLVTGNVLQVTGASALSYAALNLAGGANFVTGVLPTANQAVQTMAGDVTGTTAASVVAKVHSATVPIAGSLVTGNVLQVTGASALSYAALNLAGGANFVTGVLPIANQAVQTMAGDVTGTTAASVVAKVNAATVPVAGALVPGNVLQVTGASALSYGALNLAGGSNFVTGVLPIANQAVQTMAGDVTGTTAASVVAKVHGATVPVAGALTTGNGLYVTGASALSYSALNLAGGANFVTGVLPAANQASQTMAGDVTGTTAASVVAKAHGATVPVAGSLVTGNVLQVTGASALSYAALNLAGGANFVTGVLPVGNLPSLAGDVTGTITANTVTKLQNRSVASTLPTNGQVLTYNTGSSQWQPATVSSGSQSLAQTLVIGNITGGTNIILTSGDSLRGAPGVGATGGAAAILGGAGATNFAGGAVNITGGAGGATTGDGADVNITGGVAATSGNSGNIILTGANAVGADKIGGGVGIFCGDSTGDETGGPILGEAGNGGDAGAGGFIWFIAGDGGTTSGDGGSALLTGGASIATGDGGSTFIRSGDAGTVGDGGDISLEGGLGGSASGNGSFISITAGNAVTSGNGGDIVIDAGNGAGVSKTGGNIVITPGNSTNAVVGGAFVANGGHGGATGEGGEISLTAGQGGSASGNGGAINITSGSPQTSGRGGDITITGANGIGAAKLGGGIGIIGGTSSTTSIGPQVTIVAGQGGPTAGTGGLLLLAGGFGGAAGDGGDVTILSGAPTTSGNAGDIFLNGANALGAAKLGGGIGIIGGTSSTTSIGPQVSIVGGQGGPTAGTGGFLLLAGGFGGAAGDGGDVTILSGAPTTSGNAGDITLNGANALGASKTGGNITISGGVSTNAIAGGFAVIGGGQGGPNGGAGGIAELVGGPGGATSGDGGGVAVGGGDPTTSGNGGSVSILGGNALGAGKAGGGITLISGNSTDAIAGGDVEITSGNGGAGGSGGNVLITAGKGGSTSGTGGSITISSGVAATSGNGGAIAITANNGTGASKTGGNIGITAGNSTNAVAGGDLTLAGGQGGPTGQGGVARLEGGFGGSTSGTGGSAGVLGGYAVLTGTGGTATLQGGFGGSTSGDGGDVSILGGAPVTSGNGGDIDITAGSGLGTSKSGGAITITAGTATTNVTGGQITITSGQAGPTGNGGTLDINGGRGGSTQGNGGDINLTSGVAATLGSAGNIVLTGANGVGANQFGGGIALIGGDSTNAVAGGAIQISAGDGGVTGNGGDIQISSGNAGATSGTGGSIALLGGAGTTASAGGNAFLIAGQGGSTGLGGTTFVNGGAGGSTSGNGGVVSINGGAPTTSGNGGAISITGGSGVGINKNGGTITLTPGLRTGTGTGGSIKLQNSASVNKIEIDNTGIGFFAATPVGKPTVTGSRATGAALVSLIAAGVALGLWTDATTP